MSDGFLDYLKEKTGVEYEAVEGEIVRKEPITPEVRLREAASKALELLKADLQCRLELHCLIGEDSQPIRETLDDEQAEADVAELEECIVSLEAALGEAKHG